MFTLDEIKQILDNDQYGTQDGYNLIRTGIMEKLASVPQEFADRQSEIDRLKKENERLTAANVTLYNKVEQQILQPAGKTQEEDPEEDPEFDPEEVLADNVALYAGL